MRPVFCLSIYVSDCYLLSSRTEPCRILPDPAEASNCATQVGEKENMKRRVVLCGVISYLQRAVEKRSLFRAEWTAGMCAALRWVMEPLFSPSLSLLRRPS
jgi:hypothetical protein